VRVNAATFEIIKAALRADTTLASDERTRLLGIIKGNDAPASKKDTPRLVRRKEASQTLSVSLRMIDKLAAQGVLTKRVLPGRTRGCGFLQSDVLALVNGRAA
jgi:hypothetical protein